MINLRNTLATSLMLTIATLNANGYVKPNKKPILENIEIYSEEINQPIETRSYKWDADQKRLTAFEYPTIDFEIVIGENEHGEREIQYSMPYEKWEAIKTLYDQAEDLYKQGQLKEFEAISKERVELPKWIDYAVFNKSTFTIIPQVKENRWGIDVTKENEKLNWSLWNDSNNQSLNKIIDLYENLKNSNE
jgi:hypothetical protein